MNKLIYAAATAALFAAGGAHAQVAGGLTGNVGGSVGVGLPQVAPVSGVVRSTVGDARAVTRETVRDARDVARDAARTDAGVSVNANTRADARADRDGAAVDAAIRTGVMVHSSDGAMLGTVVDVTRNTVGRATAFTLRTADGAVRSVPAGSVSLDGDVLVTGWTRTQFMQAR